MAPKDAQVQAADRIQADRIQDAAEAPTSDAAPGDVAPPQEAVSAQAEVSNVGSLRASESPSTSVEVVFSPEELRQLEDEAARAGASVPALVRRLALARAHLRAVASVGSNNLPSNPPATPEMSSGIRVRGYNGAFSPHVGRNR